MSGTVIVNGNPRPGSRTGVFAATLTAHLATEPPRMIELSEAVAITFDADPALVRAPQPDAWDAVTEADLLVVATPSYKGTYTGLLKVFFDRFPAGALTGVRAVPVAVAGSPDHATATAADLLRLLRELGAHAPSAVAVLESQLADGDAVAAQHATRLRQELARA